MKGNGFYVYLLIDPRTGEAFYVGKGKGCRYRSHEREARNGSGSAKACRIRDIWAAGLQVEHQRLAEGLDEATAYRLERKAIAARREVLTNLTHGGGPSSVSPERARRLEAFRAECKRLVDDIVIPTVMFALACRETLDLTDPEVRQYIAYLQRGGVGEIRWHGTVIEAA